MIEIKPVKTPAEVEQIRILFREYEASLKLDLCFQSFEQELASLPGKYAPPNGCLLLAAEGGQSLGCIALRKINDDTCEMKRLFVRESARGRSLGKSLVENIIERAKNIGYKKMRLDAVADRMASAVKIYRSIGFREIPAYYETPLANTVFMELLID